MYEGHPNVETNKKASKGLQPLNSEKRSTLCCRIGLAFLGYFNVLWFLYWLLEIKLYDDVAVTGRCIEIPEESNAFVTCGALYCANRIADLITGIVLLVGVHTRNPAFLQAFVLYEMFTFISWNIIFLLQWNYSNSEADQIEYTMRFLLRRALQCVFMYVVMAFQKELQLVNEEKKSTAVRFYI